MIIVCINRYWRYIEWFIVFQDGGYNYKTPVIYTADDGYIRKILASVGDKDSLRNSLVSLIDDEWLQNQINMSEDKDIYISIPENIKL